MIQTEDVKIVIPIGMGTWGRDEFQTLLNTTLRQTGKQLVIVSADEYMTKDGRYNFDVSKLSKAHRFCQTRCREAVMERKKIVMVKNPNEQIEFIHHYDRMNYNIAIVHFMPATVDLAIDLANGSIPSFVYSAIYRKMTDMGEISPEMFKHCKGIIYYRTPP